jgi:hypothetical protein
VNRPKDLKPEDDPREGWARAYAQAYCTSAGLIWRDLTGHGIGIDAAIELP